MSSLGKRKRGGAAAPPISALAARKARQVSQPAPPPAPAPALPEIAEPVKAPVEEPVEEEEQLDEVLNDASLELEVDRVPTRYFVHRAEAESGPAQEPLAARDASPPVEVSEEPPAVVGRSTYLDSHCQSSWKPRVGDNLVVDGEQLTLRLQVRETLVLRGVCQLSVSKGQISVNGALLQSSQSISIFAPTTLPLPIVECNQPAEILLRPLRTGIEGIARLVQVAGLSARADTMWTDSTPAVAPRSAGFDIVLEPRPHRYSSRSPVSWRQALDVATESASPRHVVLVSGLPRTGKSTFARTLLNRLLSRHERVGWLDCDLGQSEFTPPGFVSLHLFDQPVVGPAFTQVRSRETSRAHFIGSTEARNNPQHYLDAIADLNDQCNRGERMPLVVNLPGYSKGLAADLQASIEAIVQATHQVHVGTAEDFARSSSTPITLVYAEPAGIEATDILRMHAAAKRQLSLLSYLHCLPVDTPSWDFSEPLVAQRPRLLPFKDVDAVHALLPEAPPESELLHLLNGSLVALVQPGRGHQAGDPMRYEAEPAFVPGSNAIGLALIRGIDTEASVLQLLTPVPPRLAQTTRILARGTIELPTVAMLDPEDDDGVAGVEWKDVPFLEAPSGSSSASRGVGSGPRRVRRNLMRRSQVARGGQTVL